MPLFISEKSKGFFKGKYAFKNVYHHHHRWQKLFLSHSLPWKILRI
jgi:hypothetical protein